MYYRLIDLYLLKKYEKKKRKKNVASSRRLWKY